MRPEAPWRLARGARGRISNLLAAARRVPRCLDPRPWIVRTRHADLLLTAAYIAAGALVLLAFGELDAPNLVVGLPPAAFILLVLIRAYRANAAQREEEAGEIAAARSMARQCRRLVGLIEESLSGSPEDYRAGLALNQLSSTVMLLVARYRRYLDKSAVWAAMEAERLIMGAGLSRDGDLKDRMRPIGHQIGIMSAGIVDIDDPLLRAGRGRI